MRQPLPAETDVRSILIISTNWIGDAVMSIPAICGVRSLYPQARISVLARSAIADLFRAVPQIDNIISFRKDKGLQRIPTILAAAVRLRRERFDLVLIFPRSLSTALIALLAGIPRRIGFASGLRGALLTDALARDAELRSLHQTHYYKRLLEPLGRPVYPELPRLTLPPDARHWAAETLRHKNLPTKAALVGLNPGSTYGEAKQWLPERFAELARKLTADGNTVIVFGDAATGPLARAITDAATGRVIDMSGRTSITQMAALIERCSVLVTNDTGPMHVACALNVPVVAVFGSTNRTTTAPADPNATIVCADLPCSPCMQRVCPLEHHACMYAVTVEMVEQAVRAKLADGQNGNQSKNTWQ